MNQNNFDILETKMQVHGLLSLGEGGSKPEYPEKPPDNHVVRKNGTTQ